MIHFKYTYVISNCLIEEFIDRVRISGKNKRVPAVSIQLVDHDRVLRLVLLALYASKFSSQ